MSDPYGSYDREESRREGEADNPYGEAPYAGQQPPPPPAWPGQQAQPPVPGQPPAGYGQYQQQPPPYGQPGPYGQPYPPQNLYGQPGAYPYPGQRPYGAPDPNRRPGTVTAGAVIAIVMSALAAVFCLIFGLAALSDDFVDDLGLTDEGATAVMVVFLIFAVWGAIGVLLASLTLRRKQGARITVIVFAFLVAVLMLLSTLTNLGNDNPGGAFMALIYLGASVGSAILLLVRSSGDWFASRPSKNHVVLPYAK